MERSSIRGFICPPLRFFLHGHAGDYCKLTKLATCPPLREAFWMLGFSSDDDNHRPPRTNSPVPICRSWQQNSFVRGQPVSIGTHDPTASRERVCCRLLCCCCVLLLFFLLLLLLLLPLACLCNFTLVHSKPELGTWSGKKHSFLYYIYKWNSRLEQILVIWC